LEGIYIPGKLAAFIFPLDLHDEIMKQAQISWPTTYKEPPKEKLLRKRVGLPMTSPKHQVTAERIANFGIRYKAHTKEGKEHASIFSGVIRGLWPLDTSLKFLGLKKGQYRPEFHTARVEAATDYLGYVWSLCVSKDCPFNAFGVKDFLMSHVSHPYF
jgi:hypothetical protein